MSLHLQQIIKITPQFLEKKHDVINLGIQSLTYRVGVTVQTAAFKDLKADQIIHLLEVPVSTGCKEKPRDTSSDSDA